MHRIAINVATSHRRREGLRALRERLSPLGRAHEARSDDTGDSSELLDALRRLPAAQAAAIVLRYVHGYTNREIATALGVAESTVASRLASARARLSTSLERTSEVGRVLEPTR